MKLPPSSLCALLSLHDQCIVPYTEESDPITDMETKEQWPDGTYAFPMPRSGCPNGWLSGNRYQDTEDYHNKNSKSLGIERKIAVIIGHDIDFYYCVKTFQGNTGYQWPRGTYCIAKKGDCPSGFKSGSLY